VHLEQSGSRRPWLVLGAVAVVAIVAAACLPPPPPPPPPTTTTTTTTPPAICGVNASAAATTSAPGGDDDGTIENRYVAVVEHNGRSKVLSRHVENAADIARFRRRRRAG
jgi:hypothetical protein